MNNDFNDFEMNNNLRRIDYELRGIKVAMKDKLYLEVYGKEAYLEMIERRRFYNTLFWGGVIAFLVGFFGVGLYMCNWDVNVLFERLGQLFFDIF